MRTDTLREHVERSHGCRARLERIETVCELEDGQLVFDGEVHVFALSGHPTSRRAYAWEIASQSGDPAVITALEVAPIGSARDAVRASRSSH